MVNFIKRAIRMLGSSFGKDDLDSFVAEVDAAGGPSIPDFYTRWGHLRYNPSIKIASHIDPYSQEYAGSMMQIYEEIAGRQYDPKTTELTSFDSAHHVRGHTAYGAGVPPRSIALHFQRLAKGVRAANFLEGQSILDMGAGWGLSTEFLSQCGLSVLAVDINLAFVNLIKDRAARYSHPTRVAQSTFQDFHTDEKFDGALFYECLHHEPEPWKLLSKIANLLKPGGTLLLAGEPIQSEFWPHWGLRKDPMSIYCIRKFGWYESGWSIEFLSDMIQRAGLSFEISPDNDPEVGNVICARKPTAG